MTKQSPNPEMETRLEERRTAADYAAATVHEIRQAVEAMPPQAQLRALALLCRKQARIWEAERLEFCADEFDKAKGHIF